MEQSKIDQIPGDTLPEKAEWVANAALEELDEVEDSEHVVKAVGMHLEHIEDLLRMHHGKEPKYS